ncbi:hypothetical protein WJX81_000135 [Elliptochloris bilobata]|uniref:PCIF1 WW domain-containing protein n=1 Tax=Elliptochloris bilobata TaxID=381761 RepID=A0AAW1SKI6_9CHLO
MLELARAAALDRLRRRLAGACRAAGLEAPPLLAFERWRFAANQAFVKLSREAYGRLAALHRRHGATAEAAPAPAADGPDAEAAAGEADAAKCGDAAEADGGLRTALHLRLFALLLRYKSITGHGYQAALPPAAFDVLHSRLGVGFECFASPLNARFTRFCSAFPDVDGPFGSAGSFFRFTALHGSYEANPPFVPAVMDAAVQRMEALLAAAEASNQALAFVVILPGWEELGAWRALSASAHMRGRVVVAAADHGFLDGASHQRRDPYRQSPWDTGVFVLQTSRASRKWPLAEDFENELRAAMAAGCPTAAAVARQRRDRGSSDREHWGPGTGVGWVFISAESCTRLATWRSRATLRMRQVAAWLLICLACTETWAHGNAPSASRSSRHLLQGFGGLFGGSSVHGTTNHFVDTCALDNAQPLGAGTYSVPLAVPECSDASAHQQCDCNAIALAQRHAAGCQCLRLAQRAAHRRPDRDASAFHRAAELAVSLAKRRASCALVWLAKPDALSGVPGGSPPAAAAGGAVPSGAPATALPAPATPAPTTVANLVAQAGAPAAGLPVAAGAGVLAPSVAPPPVQVVDVPAGNGTSVRRAVIARNAALPLGFASAANASQPAPVAGAIGAVSAPTTPGIITQAGPIRITAPAVVNASGVGVLPLSSSQQGGRPPAIVTASPALFVLVTSGNTGARNRDDRFGSNGGFNRASDGRWYDSPSNRYGGNFEGPNYFRINEAQVVLYNFGVSSWGGLPLVPFGGILGALIGAATGNLWGPAGYGCWGDGFGDGDGYGRYQRQRYYGSQCTIINNNVIEGNSGPVNVNNNNVGCGPSGGTVINNNVIIGNSGGVSVNNNNVQSLSQGNQAVIITNNAVSYTGGGVCGGWQCGSSGYLPADNGFVYTDPGRYSTPARIYPGGGVYIAYPAYPPVLDRYGQGYSPGQPFYPSYGNYYGGAGNTYVSNVNTVNNYYGPTYNAPVYSNPGPAGLPPPPPLDFSQPPAGFQPCVGGACSSSGQSGQPSSPPAPPTPPNTNGGADPGTIFGPAPGEPTAPASGGGVGTAGSSFGAPSAGALPQLAAALAPPPAADVPHTGAGPGQPGSAAQPPPPPVLGAAAAQGHSMQRPKAFAYNFPECLYTLRPGEPCAGAGTPACAVPGACTAGQRPGACCTLGFSCLAAGAVSTCQPNAAPTFNFSASTCNQVGYYGPCGGPSDCCADGWTCQLQRNAAQPICAPAEATFIPPSTESILLDYQSPNAFSGCYPNELPAGASAPAGGCVAALNLKQFSGRYGGKWCANAYDVPLLEGTPLKRAPCPQTAVTVPQITPVPMPAITTLAGGAIQIGAPPGTAAASRRRALLQGGTGAAPAPAPAAPAELPLQPVQIKAFSWYGFNDGSTMVGGLWAGSHTQVGDFATVVYRAQLLGFNAVRLPFRFSDLNLPAKNWTFPCTQDTLGMIKGNLSNPLSPYGGADYSSLAFPAPVAYPFFSASNNGICNTYLPNDSTLNRFLWVVQYLVGAGFYVIPAYMPADNSADHIVAATPDVFARNWANLWTAITEVPTFNSTLRGRVMLDLFNEPDMFALRWERRASYQGILFPSLPDLLLPAMQAVMRVDNRTLFLVQGTGQALSFPGMAWGNGFVTDKPTIAAYNISDASVFFDNVTATPSLAERIILAPHVYGPNVTGWASGTNGSDLFRMLQLSFGYLPTSGYVAANGTAVRFPVLVGDFGSALDTPEEQVFMRDFSSFANAHAPVNGTAGNITNWVWWSWNAQSLPPSGLMVPQGALTPGWDKVTALTAAPNTLAAAPNVTAGLGFGLLPWYLRQAPANGTAGPAAAAATG